MKQTNDLWADLGAMEDHELRNVLMQLFALYEEKFATDQGREEAARFFDHLQALVQQEKSCNINRR